MSSRRIGSTPFLELLPDSIAGDPAIRAAADALDGLLVPSVKAITSLLLYARLYGKEPDLLPPLRRLAEQFRYGLIFNFQMHCHDPCLKYCFHDPVRRVCGRP